MRIGKYIWNVYLKLSKMLWQRTIYFSNIRFWNEEKSMWLKDGVLHLLCLCGILSVSEKTGRWLGLIALSSFIHLNAYQQPSIFILFLDDTQTQCIPTRRKWIALLHSLACCIVLLYSFTAFFASVLVIT